MFFSVDSITFAIGYSSYAKRGATNLRKKNPISFIRYLPSMSMLVRLIMKSIHKEDRRMVKHIGNKSFSIQYLLKRLYSHNRLLYFHTELRNKSNIPFDIDFITFKIVDKKVAKQTAMQEQVLLPLRALFVEQTHPQSCLPKMRGIRLTAGMADGFRSPLQRMKQDSSSACARAHPQWPRPRRPG